MTGKPDDTLNNLLRQWHERNTSAEAELERLHRRISRSIENARFLDLPSEPPQRSLRAIRAGWWFALGSAATVLLMLGLRPSSQSPQPVTALHEPSQALPPEVQFPASQLAEKARLLAGMEEAFNGRLAWVAEHGRQVELGLLPDTARLPRDARSLAVRLIVLARQGKDSAWRPIWQADAIARDEEIVDLTAESVGDGSLRVWMHPLPDGAIAVDTDLAVNGLLPVRSSFSGVQHSGTPQRVFSSQSEDAEFQIYQIVAALPGGKGL
jgi:hypothetical protein